MKFLLLYAALATVLLCAGCVQECPEDIDPVCGEDGRTYDNDCIARAAGVTIAHVGECREEISCNDSDFGRDIFVLGTITSANGSFSDSCSDSNRVKEYYCDGGMAVYDLISCPSGYACTDGVCEEEVAPPAVCTDSDDGKEYSEKGKVTYNNEVYNDMCDDGELIEYFCKDNEVESVHYTCPAGHVCSLGRCTDQTCADTLPNPTVYAAGTVSIINRSGWFSFTDSCVGTNSVNKYSCDGVELKVERLSCPGGYRCSGGVCYSQERCYDSDGGGSREIFSRGTIYHDYTSKTDFCQSDEFLVEFSCPSSGGFRQQTIRCPSGHTCHNGECVAELECYDTDGGRDYYDRGTVWLNGDYEEDECIDDSTVREYFCENGDYDSVRFDCPSTYSCANGRCIRTEEVSCEDDDGGRYDYENRGTAELSDGSDGGIDKCLSGGQLREYYCTDSRVDHDDVNCPSGQFCDDGECIEVTCIDSDGERDPNTPGTAYISDGSYSETDRCLSESTIQEAFCSGGNVVHDTYGCAINRICSSVAGEDFCALRTCSESDDGDDPFEQGTTTADDSIGVDSCTGLVLREFMCDSNNRAVYNDHTCTDYGYYECRNSECAPTCEEDDAGRDYDTQATLRHGNKIFNDKCVGNSLVEYYCSADRTSYYSETVNCGLVGCSGGQCG